MNDAPYRLLINPARTVLVRIWASGLTEVCTREHPDAIWGPPIQVIEEPVHA